MPVERIIEAGILQIITLSALLKIVAGKYQDGKYLKSQNQVSWKEFFTKIVIYKIKI